MDRKHVEIARSSPIPAYYQIGLDIQNRILRHEWDKNGRLPGEIELAKQYNVSRITLRQALAELEKDGLIHKVRGCGTFINLQAAPIITELNYSVISDDRLQQSGSKFTAKVLEQHLVTDLFPDVSKNLKLEKNDSAVFIKRLFFVKDTPLAICMSHISAKLVPELEDKPLINGSVSQTLDKYYNLHSDRVDDYIEAVRATQSESLLLDRSYGVPLIMLQGTSYLKDGTPLEYSRTYWSGDTVRFHLSLQNGKYGFTISP